MKIKIIVEETISQEFEVEVSSMENAHEEIRKMYRNEELVLDSANLIGSQVAILDKDGQAVEWESLN